MKLTAAMLLMLAVFLSATDRVLALQVDDQRQLADGLYARGMCELAVPEYEVLIASLSNDVRAAEAGFRLGECYRILGRRAEAERCYGAVEKKFPDHPYRFRCALRRAEMLDEDRRYEEAAGLLTTLLAAPPPPESAATALFMLGQIREHQGQKTAACALYRRLILEQPASSFVPYARLSLGCLLIDEPSSAMEAESLFRQVAAQPPTPRVGAEALFQLAESQFRSKSYAASAEAYSQLAEKYPADSRTAETRLQRAWAKYYAGLAAEALRLADEACAPAGTNAFAGGDEWLYLKANCCRQVLKFNEAAQVYAILLARYPQSAYASSAAMEKALSLYKAGAFREAIQQAKGLLNDLTYKRDILWILAESHNALDESDDAIQYYQLFLNQFPDSTLAADAGYRLGYLLQKRGDWKSAAECFERMALLFPAHSLAPQSLFAAAVCRSKAGRQDDALKNWVALLQAYPGHALVEESLFQKALAEVYLKRDVVALTSLRDLLKRYPQTRFAAESHYWIGFLLNGAGRAADAEVELRQALGLQPPVEMRQRIEFLLATLLQKAGRHGEAAALYAGLLGTSLDQKMTPDLLGWLAETMLSSNQPAVCVSAGRILSERGGTEGWRQMGFFLVGRGEQARGRTNDAQTAYESALAMTADGETQARAALALGMLAYSGGRFAQAQENFDKAATLAAEDRFLPIRAQAYAGLARTLKAQGDKAGAARCFMGVAVLFDDPALVPECLFEAGDLYRQLGRKEESKKAFEELAGRYPNSPWAQRRL